MPDFPEDPQHERILSELARRHREEFLENFDAAVDKWLDKQFVRFGKWAVGGLAAALFAWLLKLYVMGGGVLK